MAKKIEITITDKDGDEVTKFYSKKLTKVVNKLPQGTLLKVYAQENNFGKQFIGDYVTSSPPNQPEEPPTIECPDGQHLENGKCVPDIIPEPDHECPAGQHWNDATQACVPDIVEPPVCPPGTHLENGQCIPDVIPPPPTTGTLWNSNTDGGWNVGPKRTITIKQGSQQPNDKSIFVAASGSPKLEIDGEGSGGVAHLVSGSGGVSNLSLKLRSRHQAGGECNNRFGGFGCAFDKSKYDLKTESCHNLHENTIGGSHQGFKDNEWHHATFSVKDADGKVEFNVSLDGKHLKQGFHNSPKPYYLDKAKFAALSWIWIRLNNSDHGRIYICATNYNSQLDLDFMFEPSKNSIALRNVNLDAI